MADLPKDFIMSKCARLTLKLLLLSLLAAATAGQDEKPAKNKNSAIDALKAEYEQATAAWQQQYKGDRGTPTPLLIERYDAWPAWSFIPRIVQFAADHAGEPEEIDALKWFVDLSR